MKLAQVELTEADLRRLATAYQPKQMCRLCCGESVCLARLCLEHLEGYVLSLQDRRIICTVEGERDKFRQVKAYVEKKGKQG